MDKFKILEKLGSGNQGSVYLVEDIKTSKKYALKTLVLKQDDEFNSMNETLKEFSVLKLLNHENICEYIDVIVNYNEDSNFGTINITMPYCSFGDLESYLNKKRKELNEEKILNFCLQICKAVNYLHENNIIHRDLKPSNIFLMKKKKNEKEEFSNYDINKKIVEEKDENENEEEILLKLGDFGFSTFSKEKSLKMTMCGTAFYIAPEVINENIKYYNGFKSDMFSLGALFYNILTGFEKNLYIKFISNEEEALKEICFDLENKSCSKYLNEIILKLLRTNPEERINCNQTLNLLKFPIKHFVNPKSLSILFLDSNFSIFQLKNGKLNLKLFDQENQKILKKPEKFIFSENYFLRFSLSNRSTHLFNFENKNDQYLSFQTFYSNENIVSHLDI